MSHDKDAMISRLHAIHVAEVRPALTARQWWVFTGVEPDGKYIFTYQTTQQSPGPGWVKIPIRLVRSVRTCTEFDHLGSPV